jgi:hypothetical protein
MNDQHLDITAAAMVAINEMTLALDKFKTVIAKFRSNLEEELISTMNMETVTAYDHLKYPRKQNQNPKRKLASDVEPF